MGEAGVIGLAPDGVEFAVEFLTEEIQRAARGQRVLDPIAADALLSGLAHQDELNELTPREHEVMALVTAGHSNKEIAAALGVSGKTVEAHRAKVMEKMQAPSLAELVRMALQLDRLA